MDHYFLGEGQNEADYYEECILSAISSIAKWQLNDDRDVSYHLLGDRIRQIYDPKHYKESVSKMFSSFNADNVYRERLYQGLVKVGVDPENIGLYLDGKPLNPNGDSNKFKTKLYYWTTTEAFEGSINQDEEKPLTPAATPTAVSPTVVTSEPKTITMNLEGPSKSAWVTIWDELLTLTLSAIAVNPWHVNLIVRYLDWATKIWQTNPREVLIASIGVFVAEIVYFGTGVYFITKVFKYFKDSREAEDKRLSVPEGYIKELKKLASKKIDKLRDAISKDNPPQWAADELNSIIESRLLEILLSEDNDIVKTAEIGSNWEYYTDEIKDRRINRLVKKSLQVSLDSQNIISLLNKYLEDAGNNIENYISSLPPDSAELWVKLIKDLRNSQISANTLELDNSRKDLKRREALFDSLNDVYEVIRVNESGIQAAPASLLSAEEMLEKSISLADALLGARTYAAVPGARLSASIASGISDEIRELAKKGKHELELALVLIGVKPALYAK